MKHWEDKPFIDEMLYVVDGELLNHIIKMLKAFKLSPELETTLPQYQKILNFMIKSIIQCSNFPTGEVNQEIDEIELENWLWECGIKLPNPDDPDNQYPEEDE
jgi:hypothetical protein|tara:strand:+ start:2049 stop:2357 length:309 start_codon:yes stop_codon:yes gene_type:complete